MCNNIFLETNCDKRQVNFVTLIRKQFNGAKYSKTHPFKEVGLGKAGGSLHLPILTSWITRIFMAIACNHSIIQSFLITQLEFRFSQQKKTTKFIFFIDTG